MMRSRLITIRVLFLSFVLLTLLLGFRSFVSSSWGQWRQVLLKLDSKVDNGRTFQSVDNNSLPGDIRNSDRYKSALPYVKAIMDLEDKTLPRLECPLGNLSRYEYLKTANYGRTGKELKYFFALDLRQCVKILPRLIGSIVEAVRFLGPQSCALSIVEGNSDDGTFETLDLLRPELDKLGLEYFLQSTSINPKEGERISKLAELRNMALNPLNLTSVSPDANTTVIFLNDVAPCVTDLFELIHQRTFQSADMTCAMDWTYVGDNPTFYDVWVARTLKGDTFFNIPSDGSWDYAWNLFWNDPDTKQRFSQVLPFQVFACWNGAVVFGAGPILGSEEGGNDGEIKKNQVKKVAFRGPMKGECYGGEPTLFCKDLWQAGYNRIAVVPSVNLEYSDEAALKIKKIKGYTSSWTEKEDAEAVRISWFDEPPPNMKCMPDWENQSWRPWNEILT